MRLVYLLRLWPIAALFFLAALVMLWKLGEGNLTHWDEAIYAQVSKEILESGSWLTLHWEYKPWFEKPPLFIWSTAILFELFGVSEFWARAASAFSGIGLVITTYLIGSFAYNRYVGLLAGLILLTTFPFVFGARFGTTDIMLSLCIFLAIYAFMRLENGSRKWWYVIWVSCAMAVMVKGAAGLIAPIAIAVALFCDRESIRSREFFYGLLLALVIVVPWHVVMYMNHGQDFISMYFGYQVVARVTSALEEHVGSPLYYVEALNRLFLPWFYLAPFALALNIQENFQHRSRSRVLLIILWLVFGLYTLVRTKLDWYIVPLYPVLAVFIACTLHQAFQSHRSVAFGGLVLGAVMVALSTPPKVLVAILGVGLLATLLCVAYRKKLSYQLIVVVISSLFALSGIRRVEGLYHKKETPVAQLARTAGNTGSKREPLIIANFSFNGHLDRPTPLFYANRPIDLVLNGEDLAEATRDGQEREMIIEKRNVEALSAEYEIHDLADAGPFTYATIQSRPLKGTGGNETG